MKKLLAITAALAALGAVPAVAAQVDGTAGGTFVNAQPAGSDHGAVGASTFQWGVSCFPSAGCTSQLNTLTFAGNGFSSAFETPFKVGTLTYFNGSVVGNLPSTVDLSLATTFTNPLGVGLVTTSFTLSLITTTNTGDPNGDADFVNLPGSFVPQTFDVGGTLYTVTLVDFENVHGDGFLGSTGTSLHVREGLTATADLFAKVTADTSGVITGVPETSTWAMMLIGFAGLGFAGYKQARRRMIAA
jgi:hypothetical protein